jgi:hypothetical protein
VHEMRQLIEQAKVNNYALYYVCRNFQTSPIAEIFQTYFDRMDRYDPQLSQLFALIAQHLKKQQQ